MADNSSEIDDAWDELIGGVTAPVPPPPEFAGADDEELQVKPSAALPLDVVPMSGGDTDVLDIEVDDVDSAPPVTPPRKPPVVRSAPAEADGVAAPQSEVDGDPLLELNVSPPKKKNATIRAPVIKRPSTERPMHAGTGVKVGKRKTLRVEALLGLKGETNRHPVVSDAGEVEVEEVELDVDDIMPAGLTRPNAAVRVSVDASADPEVESPPVPEDPDPSGAETAVDSGVHASEPIPAARPTTEPPLRVAGQRSPTLVWGGAAVAVAVVIGWVMFGGDAASTDTADKAVAQASTSPAGSDKADKRAHAKAKAGASAQAGASANEAGAEAKEVGAGTKEVGANAAGVGAAAEGANAKAGAVGSSNAGAVAAAVDPAAAPDADAEDDDDPAAATPAGAVPDRAAFQKAGKAYVAAATAFAETRANESVEAMAIAACQMDDGARARAAFRKLRGAEPRKRVARTCQAASVNLWAKTVDATASELRRAAERHLAWGEVEEALEVARASNLQERTAAALLIMGDAYCRLGKTEKAQGLVRHIPLRMRSQLTARCKAAGLNL